MYKREGVENTEKRTAMEESLRDFKCQKERKSKRLTEEDSSRAEHWSH